MRSLETSHAVSYELESPIGIRCADGQRQKYGADLIGRGARDPIVVNRDRHDSVHVEDVVPVQGSHR